MTSKELMALIKEKRAEFAKHFDPSTFVLNKKAMEIQNEISDLQKECSHEFENGVCKICGAEENK